MIGVNLIHFLRQYLASHEASPNLSMDWRLKFIPAPPLQSPPHQSSPSSASLRKLLRYIAERRRHRARWVGALQQADVPLALINGLEDPISGRRIVGRWKQLLPTAPVFELPGVGHYPQVEASDDVVAAYLKFVEVTGSPR